MNLFRKKAVAVPTPPPRRTGFFNSDMEGPVNNRNTLTAEVLDRTFQRPIEKVKGITTNGEAMDATPIQEAKALNAGVGLNVPDAQLCWYGNMSFIGYQTMAIIAQQWLVDKACTMPAKDAVRKWFDISAPEDEELPEGTVAKLKKIDKRMRLKHECVQFIRMGRIFGIRICLFHVDGIDYTKPFNIDGVKPGSYRGMSQIDPYWVTPELDGTAMANPGAMGFYEPTYWRINGLRYHKSHLVITRTNEVPDILKPTYFYGGVSIPQKIFERVYASERTANEAPILALTKRTTALYTDLDKAQMNLDAFLEKMNLWAYLRDNLGIKLLGTEDKIEQFDTSLTDLDAAIMTQYQLVAAASDVPATKLLGTTPKGFNPTGEYDEKSYHEMLESLQESELTPLVNRHHELAIKSEVSPGAPFEVEISWKPLDTPTAAERATINLTKAQTGAQLQASGAIGPEDERQRVIDDPDSGYVSVTDIGDMTLEDDETDADAE